MKIFSLPKYNMTLKKWGELFLYIAYIIIFGIMFRDCLTALSADSARINDVYETCKPICYPNPVAGYHFGPDGECVCNTSMEYR